MARWWRNFQAIFETRKSYEGPYLWVKAAENGRGTTSLKMSFRRERIEVLWIEWAKKNCIILYYITTSNHIFFYYLFLTYFMALDMLQVAIDCKQPLFVGSRWRNQETKFSKQCLIIMKFHPSFWTKDMLQGSVAWGLSVDVSKCNSMHNFISFLALHMLQIEIEWQKFYIFFVVGFSWRNRLTTC